MQELDVVVIGAGLGGLCAAIALRTAGIGNIAVLERAGEVGGTWRDNTYPGCACDVPSHLYSLSFAPKRDWSQSYPSQPEIQAYILSVVEKYKLRDVIRLNANVTGLRWQAEEGGRCGRWCVNVDGVPAFLARYVVGALGPLNKVSIPDIDGRAQFAGAQFHSSQWQHGVDLKGKCVAVIGTGASAVQIVPKLADLLLRTGGHLSVFQRTPVWIVPRNNAPYGALRRWVYRFVPGLQKANRWRIYWFNEFITQSFLGNQWVRHLVRGLGIKHLHRQVKDAKLRAQLTPQYEPGCKRLGLSDDFYPALQMPHVALVTQGIARIEPNAIVTQDGVHHPVDAIVWATGFKVSEFIESRMRIVGEDGQDLAHMWGQQPAAAHLGITVAGFPNLFLVVGPGTGLGSNSIIFMIESQVRYIVQAIQFARSQNNSCLRTRYDCQTDFYTQLQSMVGRTVWASGCSSWYQTTATLGNGSAPPRIDTLWPSYTTAYWWKTLRFDPAVFE